MRFTMYTQGRRRHQNSRDFTYVTCVCMLRMRYRMTGSADLSRNVYVYLLWIK